VRGEAPWNEANDFSLWRGLLREYAEELLGADEDHGSELAPIAYAAWPLAKAMTDGLAGGRVRAWRLGLGADPLTFAIDLLGVVVIDAPPYEDLFGAAVATNAEGLVTVPTLFDDQSVTTLLRDARCRRPPRRCSLSRSRTAARSSGHEAERRGAAQSTAQVEDRLVRLRPGHRHVRGYGMFSP
jgi:hypothetical protein